MQFTVHPTHVSNNSHQQDMHIPTDSDSEHDSSSFYVPSRRMGGPNLFLPIASTQFDAYNTPHPQNASPPLTPAIEHASDTLYPDQSLIQNDQVDLWLDDDSLTSIEKIYLYSRSKVTLHRQFMAQHLVSFLEDVSPQEAAEYVLPLLGELAIDEEDAVQQTLTDELCSILSWFFSHCDVTDFSPETYEDIDPAPEEVQEPNPPDLPVISIQMVTAILATLLISPNSSVCSAARTLTVGLLSALSPPERGSSTSIQDRLICQEIILQIVIGMGQLDGSESIDHSFPTESVEEEGASRTDPQPLSSDASSTDSLPTSEESDGTLHAEEINAAAQDSDRVPASEAPASGEVALGRVTSMTLIAAVAANDKIDLSPVNVDSFVNEVSHAGKDELFWIRSEAALAMGSLVKVVPDEVVIATLMPLHAAFSQDSHWRVRHASLLALPNLLERLPVAKRKALAVSLLTRMVLDAAPEVRSGILEILGETVHKFADGTEEPPAELLQLFLGEREEWERFNPSLNQKPNVSEGKGDATTNVQNSHVIKPVASGQSLRSLFERKTDNYWRKTIGAPLDFFSLPQRDLICAYNYPAVILTLGIERWNGRVRDYYLELWEKSSFKVRHTLTASIGEVCKILGAERARADILELWKARLRDEEASIRMLAVEQLPIMLELFKSEHYDAVVHDLAQIFDSCLRGWRERLAVVDCFLTMVRESRDEGFAELFSLALRDVVNAVRIRVVELIPEIFTNLSPTGPLLVTMCERVASLATSSRHQHRSMFLSCYQSLALHGEVDGFSAAMWLDQLQVLSLDKVPGVRIGAARLVGVLLDSVFTDRHQRPEVLVAIATCLQKDDVHDVRSLITAFSFSDGDSDSLAESTELVDTSSFSPFPTPPSATTEEDRSNDQDLTDTLHDAQQRPDEALSTPQPLPTPTTGSRSISGETEGYFDIALPSGDNDFNDSRNARQKADPSDAPALLDLDSDDGVFHASLALLSTKVNELTPLT